MLFRKTFLAPALVSLSLAACGQTATPVEPSAGSLSLSAARAPKAAAENPIDRINARLAAEGAPIRFAHAQYVTGGPDARAAGQTIFATDRELRLPSRWVPFDPVRERDDTLSYVVFQQLAAANGSIDSEPEIDAALATWEDVTCSKLDIVKLPDSGAFPSAVLGGNFFLADIVNLGFLPGVFFDTFVEPGAAQNTLGVTFTAIWVDTQGTQDPADDVPTDFDGNGYNDTALAEIWYNDDFEWSDTGAPGLEDIQTVAFHENGHGLGLGHFGRVSITDRNGKVHVSPRAAMNAFILSVLRRPLGTDNAAYCGLYGSWPD
jgi:hypothetical protein